MFRRKINVAVDAVLTVNIVSAAESLIVCCTHFTGKIAFVTLSGMRKNWSNLVLVRNMRK